eukprot:CAMPEP_0202723936 /NCGR_PEP_ID=MMETSP1385-20130828/169553_1 /ASSEMBLY_ACC=CAM_ASM_000861 /TAXON_ID=933848 /ORGANISM="Elphidium margaritaceum" /LENGTH=35 /DNA_ID= /DNA_START= /DNA_END= /DNA_ORIENTATION=
MTIAADITLTLETGDDAYKSMINANFPQGSGLPST